jgi:hypothetical protein
VSSLEVVVVQLQASVREALQKAERAKRDSDTVRIQAREREEFWRTLVQNRKHSEDGSLPLPPVSPTHYAPTHLNNASPVLARSGVHYSSGNGNGLSVATDPTSSSRPSYAAASEYAHSTYSASSDEAPSNIDSTAAVKYNSYSYTMASSSRPHHWSPIVNASATDGVSPTQAGSELAYATTFATEDRKAPITSLDAAAAAAPFVYATDTTRSSPSSSTPPLYSYGYEASANRDRPDYPYGRPSLAATGADVSVTGAGPGSDAVRHRLGARRTALGDGSIPPPMPLANLLATTATTTPTTASAAATDGSDRHGASGSERGSPPLLQPPLVGSPSHGGVDSRSASPEMLQSSSSLAVIKAQSFGALRRTRARKKSDSASRVAADTLKDRGISMGVSASGTPPPAKKRRLSEEED